MTSCCGDTQDPPLHSSLLQYMMGGSHKSATVAQLLENHRMCHGLAMRAQQLYSPAYHPCTCTPCATKDDPLPTMRITGGGPKVWACMIPPVCGCTSQCGCDAGLAATSSSRCAVTTRAAGRAQPDPGSRLAIR